MLSVMSAIYNNNPAKIAFFKFGLNEFSISMLFLRIRVMISAMIRYMIVSFLPPICSKIKGNLSFCGNSIQTTPNIPLSKFKAPSKF